MFIKIKRFTNLVLLELFCYLMIITCYFKQAKIAAYIIKLSLRKNKKIQYKKICKTFIVLEKSYGIDDLNQSFNNHRSEILFLILQRKLIRVIFNFFFKGHLNEINETNYQSNKNLINKKKIEYRYFLNDIIKELKNLINLNGFISFNLFYLSERELQISSINNSLKFLVCHKENVCSKWLNIIRSNVWKYKMGKVYATKVSVYSKYAKKALIKSDVIEPSKIVITGMPRSDIYFNKKITCSKKYILFLMIENTAQLPYFNNQWITNGIKKKIKPFKWNLTENLTFETMVKFAKLYKKTEIIFKTKPNTSINFAKKIKELNLKNCRIVEGGGSIDLIKNSKIVVAFNTTGILESLILKKPVVVPDFEYSKIKKNFMLNFNQFVHRPKNIKQMLKILNNLNKKKNIYKFRNIKKLNKTLKEHIHNTDGTSGKKLRKFIQSSI